MESLRRDDITINLPFGVTVRGSGKQVTLIILVVLGVGCVLWMLREHDLKAQDSFAKVERAQVESIQTLENIGYILTLSEEERKRLKLTMPPKLRKQLLAEEREQ